MEKIIEKLVIKHVMDSAPYTFRDVNFENCSEELKPLIIALLNNYFYLKAQNPENKPCENSFFIQQSGKK